MNLRERLRMLRPAAPAQRATSTGSGTGAGTSITAAAFGPELSGSLGSEAAPPAPGVSPAPRVSPAPGASPAPWASPARRVSEADFSPWGAWALPPVDGVEQRLVSTPFGRVLCLERVYPLDHVQGRVPVEACLRVPRRGWQRLVSRALPETFDAANAAFVDLETTGLARGTGTYAFLVGVGRFTEEGFRVRQYFLRDYPEEPAVMAAVQAELESARGLITFNGRAFDWPLLETRATLNRLRLPSLPHLDLLYPARRVWRPLTDSCRLADLEATVLGHCRHDDVPGALIPQLYFHYLRTGDPQPLAGVFEHNRLDIVSMACMAGYLGQAAAEPLSAQPAGTPLPGPELYSLGRLLLDQGAVDEAIACLEEALARGLPHGLRREGYRLLAIAHRRRCGRASQDAGPGAAAEDPTVAVLLQWIREDSLSTWPYVELAKHYEHRLRDLEAARHWTLRAIDLVQRRRALRGLAAASRVNGRAGVPAPADRELEELLHRLRRLERKLAASAGRRARAAAGSGRGAGWAAGFQVTFVPSEAAQIGSE
ncbi:MAG TPA: ribonuclease H-like domain-containing protein [Limnochordales bacterium]